MAPYKSKMQSRYFHYLENKGKLPKKTVDEFDNATDFENLPEEAHYSSGGKVHKSIEDRKEENKAFYGRFKSAEDKYKDPFYIPSKHDADTELDDMDDKLYEKYPETAVNVFSGPTGGRNDAIMKHRQEMEGYAHGGVVEDEEDYDMGHEDEHDSSGEPHTEDEMEDKHPMEYMSRGGKVKRMAKGGMSRHPGFVRALRKSY